MNTLATIPQNTQMTAAASAAIEQIRAEITIARSMPRSMEVARRGLLETAKRPAFAEIALYRLPFGQTPVIGPSIRLAEEVIRLWGNLKIDYRFERYATDANGYGVEVASVIVTDLETNTSITEPMIVPLTAERKRAKGTVVGERMGAGGQRLFIVKLGESEIRRERGKARSIARRNAILTLVPRDLIDEVIAQVQQTLQSQDKTDPRASGRRLLDRLTSAYHVNLEQLAHMIGADLDNLTPHDCHELRRVGEHMRDTGQSWRDLYAEFEATLEPAATVEQKPDQPKSGPLDGIASQNGKREDF